MRQLIKTVLSNLLMISMLCVYTSSLQPVYAHDTGMPHQEQQQPTAKPASYSYSTPPGCSLSLLARRSLQLLNQETTDISLTPAQAMYAETNIVKQLGDRWLAVGEKVVIDKSLVENYARSSQSLTPAQTVAWQYYANQADFNVADITPDATPTTAQQQPASQTATNESEQKPAVQPAAAKSSSPAWYLWLIIGVTLGGMYFMMNRRPAKK